MRSGYLRRGYSCEHRAEFDTCSAQVRHHGSEETVQDVHNLPIREVFIFPEQNNFAKIDWQLLNRRTHLLGLQFAYVMVVRVFGWLDDVVGSVIPGTWEPQSAG